MVLEPHVHATAAHMNFVNKLGETVSGTVSAVRGEKGNGGNGT